MKKNILRVTASVAIAALLSGCCHGSNCPNSGYKHWNLNSNSWGPDVLDTTNMVINDLASQLFDSNKIKKEIDMIAITSFVDIDKLNKTSHFGRILSESMYSELYNRGINVADFRGQKSLMINANGEYFLSRDYTKLKKGFYNRYVLVGTYGKFGKGYLINARIIDNTTGQVVAAARSIYDNNDCSIGDNCSGRLLPIITDGCSTVTCPNVGCRTVTNVPTKIKSAPIGCSK